MTDWTIEQADVVEWAKRYRGDKYHFLFCDPPYHLTSVGRLANSAMDKEPATLDEDKLKSSGMARFFKSQTGFMGQVWDGGDVSFQPETWAAFLPLMHDGAFGAAYAASRNWHRMAVAIEDAGFFIHDTLFLWVQGQGMPKGSRVDRHYQEQRHGWDGNGMRRNAPAISNQAMLELSLRERLEIWREERRWQGHRYGLQTLAPRVEPILIFQKPWSGVQRDNVIETGAGCMNVDGCRIHTSGSEARDYTVKRFNPGATVNATGEWKQEEVEYSGRTADGRWPSNFGLVHTPDCVWIGEKRVKSESGGERPAKAQSNGATGWQGNAHKGYKGSDGFETVDDWACSPGCPARRLGEMTEGTRASKPSGTGRTPGVGPNSWFSTGEARRICHDDGGGAARYFPQFDWRYDIAERLLVADPVRYVPKVGTGEREAGLDGTALRTRNRVNPGGLEHEPRFAPVERHNDHPTLKPISLNQWLCTLFLPPEGFQRRVLIPFAGVMSEGIGALLSGGWDEITAVEMGVDYCDIGRARMAWWAEQVRWGLRDVEAVLKVWSGQRREAEEREAEPEPEQLGMWG